MKRAYTPGPWVVDLRAQESPLIRGGVERIAGLPQTVVAEVYPEDGDDEGKATRANANLIAAAPELLAALKAVCVYYVDVNTPFADKQERHAVEIADAALRKAEGRAA